VNVGEPQRAAMSRLSVLLPANSYLGGGVAVALRFDHRTSEDLDFFVSGSLDAATLADTLAVSGPEITVTSIADRTVYAVVEGVPVSILGYRHPLLHAPESRSDVAVAVASNEDLVCMKLSAIGNRGAAKDFWDLDVMLEAGVCGGSLAGALACFRAKYPSIDPGYVVRALGYFGQADAEPLPRGLDREAWREIRRRFERRLEQLLAR